MWWEGGWEALGKADLWDLQTEVEIFSCPI